MEEGVFRRLQEQLDQYSIGFPATDSGVEIEILQEMFTEQEAAMFTALTAELETAESVAHRINKPAQEVATQLENMAQKGLLFRRRKGQLVEYSAVPFIHGLLEFQINRIGKNVVKLVGQYIKEKLKDSIVESLESFIRTIPIQHSLEVTHNVAAYDDACEILRNEELIVITDCACRRQQVLLEKDCAQPIEVCFMFGPMGQYYIDNGLGRQIDFEEALKILTSAQEAGLVTQSTSAQKPFSMCNCCGDCCGFLYTLRKHPKPADLIASNYSAKLDQRKCSGCETCVERCVTRAVKMHDGGPSAIDQDRCIGCGLCVTTCPEKAIQLTPKPEEMHRKPPVDTPDQMTRMARKRGLQDIDPSRIVSFGF